MFYYLASKKPKLEVQIIEEYTEAAFDRVILLVDALIDGPSVKVIFKVKPSLRKHVELHMAKRFWLPFFAFKIKEIQQ